MRRVATATAFILVVVGLGLGERVMRPLGGGADDAFVQLQSSRQDLATSAGSGYLADIDVSTPALALRFLPTGLLHFLTVPLPWQLGSMLQNVVIPETLVWVLLYPFVIGGIRAGMRSNHAATLLVLLLTGGMCVIYALLAANVGVAYRMRTQVWLFWAPFAMWGWHNWQHARRSRAQASASVVMRERERARRFAPPQEAL